jgi:2-oxoglutarate dehydrogenase E2 component (dihydrolipoamide succinyltransferase)
MSIEVKVPVFPESVADATVIAWHKKIGDTVKRDENLVDLETDKVVMEVPSPHDGVLESILLDVGKVVHTNEILATINDKLQATPTTRATDAQPSRARQQAEQFGGAEQLVQADHSNNQDLEDLTSPVVRRLISEHKIDPNTIAGTGKDGRIVKEDVLNFIEKGRNAAQISSASQNLSKDLSGRMEKRVPMSRLRAKIAQRLVEVQHNAAILTTFNEVNLQAIMDLRAKYKDKFEKKHNIKLGFMSFFTKAAVEALKSFPAVNASIDGEDIVYHNYYDVGVAVSTERGLVVPVLRNADLMSLGEIERHISDSANRARDNKLTIEEMQGGTFTITNGGTFGSMLSTPIINAPQSAILGMHKITERVVVENGQIVIRPMMYVALSYDHRIVDGKDSVRFLVTIKELLEDPARLLLNI